MEDLLKYTISAANRSSPILLSSSVEISTHKNTWLPRIQDVTISAALGLRKLKTQPMLARLPFLNCKISTALLNARLEWLLWNSKKSNQHSKSMSVHVSVKFVLLNLTPIIWWEGRFVSKVCHLTRNRQTTMLPINSVFNASYAHNLRP